MLPPSHPQRLEEKFRPQYDGIDQSEGSNMRAKSTVFLFIYTFSKETDPESLYGTLLQFVFDPGFSEVLSCCICRRHFIYNSVPRTGSASC